MENFAKYFRRLLTANSPQVFPGISRNVENAANYPLLVQEMDRIKTDPAQATRIAEAMEAAEGDISREFDLALLVQHFKLDPFSTTLLASAFTRLARSELRSRAGALLRDNLEPLLTAIAEGDAEDPLPTACALRYLDDETSTVTLNKVQDAFRQAFELRSQKGASPDAAVSLYSIIRMNQTEGEFYQRVRKAGPGISYHIDSAKRFIEGLKPTPNATGAALLYMAILPDWPKFNLPVFVSALDSAFGPDYDWAGVIESFDHPFVAMTRDPFLTLYRALFPLARQRPQVDLQRLWGGQWHHTATQLTFLDAFLASDVDVQEIPRFRAAFPANELMDKPFAEELWHSPMISADAVEALLDVCLPADRTPDQQHVAELARIVNEKMGLFVCSAAMAPRTRMRQQLLQSFLQEFVKRKRPNHGPILHAMWQLDKKMVALSLSDAHLEDPLELTSILDLALEQNWLKELLTLTTGFAFDLAALAHRKGLVDFREWAETKMEGDKSNFINALSRFVVIKAQDELRISRDEQPEPRTVSLAMQTAYDMVTILDEHMQDRTELKAIQRTFLQAYPRLILLCEGVRQGIDVDCKTSNAMPRSADAEMQDLYKKMYGKELEVSAVIEYLGRCKDSGNAAELDLFACMIHGLFDEYSCFSEYPLDPLQKTALLFGGMIQVGVISALTLRVAREMVLDAVSDYPSDASMFKFGLQALSTFQNRLPEPEWAEYCQALLQVPNLQNTQIRSKIADALEGKSDASPSATAFSAVRAPVEALKEEPSDDVKDKVVFFFNNVSEQNLEAKARQLDEALRPKTRAWFSHSLVATRAMLEPNYQPLYLQLLRYLEDAELWTNVLCSTYAVIERVINSPMIVDSSTERKNLKSLATWLGSLTLARDQPIKRRHISFPDLLAEGVKTERLILVIPFVCHVLAQGRTSIVFRPPNPWVMEILQLLVELYREFNISTNQKFDIEVVCDELGVDLKKVAASTMLQERVESRPEDLIGATNGDMLKSRFETGTMEFDLPDFEHRLNFPSAPGNAASQAKLHEVVVEAVTHAIYDIIGSVVERSVTIAAIATSQLIHKDFACEPSETRVRIASQQQVRQLAKSLALVTAKEPLKTSMSNFIRKTLLENPEYAFPEGTILMCINDNLETACRVVEEQAAEQAQLEMEGHIEDEIALRRRYRAEHPSELYIGPAQNRWAALLQDPFKIVPSIEGLSAEQVGIYAEFDRQVRIPLHGQTASADSGRQLPDVLQEGYPYHQSSRPVPNGQSMDPNMVEERFLDQLAELNHFVRRLEHLSDAEFQRVPAIMELLGQIWDFAASNDQIAMILAETICKGLFQAEEHGQREIDLITDILARLCQSFGAIAREVAQWAETRTDSEIMMIDITVELIVKRIMQTKKVDQVLSLLLSKKEASAALALESLVERLLLDAHPSVLRTDFAKSLGAFAEWHASDEASLPKTTILTKLAGEEGDRENDGMVKKHQINYIFCEWIRLCEENSSNPTDKMFAAFVAQLQVKRVLESTEDLVLFVRVAIDAATMTYDFAHQEERMVLRGSKDHDSRAFHEIDWLARLLVHLVRSAGPEDLKSEYLNRVLSIIILIMNHHQVSRRDHFNQRVFFRLLSSMLCDWHDFATASGEEHEKMATVFANSFRQLGPRYFPQFVHAWLLLISHRFLLPEVLQGGVGVSCKQFSY